MLYKNGILLFNDWIFPLLWHMHEALYTQCTKYTLLHKSVGLAQKSNTPFIYPEARISSINIIILIDKDTNFSAELKGLYLHDQHGMV